MLHISVVYLLICFSGLILPMEVAVVSISRCMWLMLFHCWIISCPICCASHGVFWFLFNAITNFRWCWLPSFVIVEVLLFHHSPNYNPTVNGVNANQPNIDLYVVICVMSMVSAKLMYGLLWFRSLDRCCWSIDPGLDDCFMYSLTDLVLV